MKGIFKTGVVIATAFGASSVFAAGLFSSHGQGRTYTESSYWSAPRTVVPNSASAGGSYNAPVTTNGPIVTTPQVIAAPGPTMGPWYQNDTITNASSALWGVGG
ncbi:MAG TPA: hypothetical protein VHL85_09085 [Burkholderiales bacterium]|nr:hypothetical protein [Burkholderiales bacterium]